MGYIWTIQSKEVLSIINREGCYYPDFYYDSKRCNAAYKLVLDSFNKLNQSEYKGLIFGFAKYGKEEYFENIDELYKYFMDHPLITDAFDLWDENHVILKLQYKDTFNMIPVDFNDFIQIMPPIWDRNVYQITCACIEKGVYVGGHTLPSFTQVHVPFINAENIIEVYGNFDKRRSKEERHLVTFSLEE